jgi:hypothetical protein
VGLRARARRFRFKGAGITGPHWSGGGGGGPP